MSSKIQFWEPLWGTASPRVMDQDEMSVIEKITRAADLDRGSIEPVLDIKNRKMLRVKLYTSTEYERELYDYLFFGPVTFNGSAIYMSQPVVNELSPTGGTKNNMLGVDQLIAIIKREVSVTLASRARKKLLYRDK